jgi:hypothetical protein
MFKQAFNTSNPSQQPREFAIATGTAIEKGEIVKLSAGLVVAIGDADQDDPYLGVAAEEHDGATAGRQSGLVIKVYCHPDDVFVTTPKDAITATGGSTTTFVDSNLTAGFGTDDLLNGGYIQLVNVQNDTSLNGKKIKISDYAQASGTITLSETLPVVIASGDTAYLCPGKRAVGNYAHDLNSDGTEIDWETAGGESIIIFDVDPETFKVFVKLRLHQLGNHVAAL